MQIKRLVVRNAIKLGRLYRVCVDGGTMDVVIDDFVESDILRCTKYVLFTAPDGVQRMRREAEILLDTNHISWISLHDMEQYARVD